MAADDEGLATAEVAAAAAAAEEEVVVAATTVGLTAERKRVLRFFALERGIDRKSVV